MSLVRWLTGTGSLLLGSLLLSGSLSGCSISSPSAAAELDQIEMRMVHLSPEAPPLTLLVGDMIAIRTLFYGRVSDYVSLPAGQHDLSLSAALRSSDQTLPGGSIPTTAYAVLPGEGRYSVLAIDEPSRIEAIILDDRQEPDFNRALVRLVHAAPDLGLLEWSVNDETVLAQDLDFGQVMAYQPIEPGFVQINLRTGAKPVADPGPVVNEEPTDDSFEDDFFEDEFFADEPPPADLPPDPRSIPGVGTFLGSFDLEMEAGGIYTLYATGLQRADPGLQLIVSEETEANRGL